MRNTKMLALIVLLVLFSAAVYRFWGVCLTFFFAMVAAYLLGPPARLISRKLKVRHGLAVALIVVLFVVAVTLLVSMSVPYVVSQVAALMRDIGTYAGSFDQLVQGVHDYLMELGLPQPVLDTFLSLASRADVYLMGLFTSIMQTMLNLSAGVFDLIVVVILVIYFMLDGKKLQLAFMAALPLRLRQSALRVTRSANLLTRRYIKSRVLISAGMGVVTYIGFTIMGIRYALLFAVLSFALDFIPYFGSLIAGAIETVYALIVGGPALALTVGIFVLIVQQIEGNVVAPKVQGDATGIHPVTVMFALLACNQVFGPIGMIISTPVAAIVKSIFKETYLFIVTPDGYDPAQLTLDDD